MKASRRLIDGLRRAANDVLYNSYSWSDPKICNCGTLSTALGLEPQRLSHWTWLAKCALNPDLKDTVCTSSGRSIKDVYDALLEAGLEHNDFEFIEFCGLTTYDKRGQEDIRYKNRDFVSQFFSDLADKLELELAQNEVAQEVVTKVIDEEQQPQQVHVRRK